MSEVARGPGDAGARTGAGSGGSVSVLLECFSGRKAAGAARKDLDAQLKTHGGILLDSVILEVDAKNKAAVHDPRRVLQATLTAFLTWGVFGLIAGGWESFAIWAILGAICGGLWALYTEHLLNKNELSRLGSHVPADSSALVTFAQARDARAVLAAASAHQPTVSSAVAIGPDLSTRVYAGAVDPIEVATSTGQGTIAPGRTGVLSMVVFRYPDATTAKQVAAAHGKSKGAPRALDIELVLHADPSGRRHVSSPSYGAAANSVQSLISWALFGLVCGAVVGLFSGGGLLGALHAAIVTGVLWGLFGIVAGALFGLWAGRGVSARRLRSVGAILGPNTSMLLAWTEHVVDDTLVAPYLVPNAQRLVVRFNPVQGGAVLEAL